MLYYGLICYYDINENITDDTASKIRAMAGLSVPVRQAICLRHAGNHLRSMNFTILRLP